MLTTLTFFLLRCFLVEHLTNICYTIFKQKAKEEPWKKIYNKLVRDNIPNIIANDNEEVFTSTLTIEEYQEALLNKLQEEANEVKKAKTKKEILEELADVLEVLDAISCSQGSDLTEVTRIKEEKKATKGGFSKRIYLHKTITK